jgi:multidrug efflux system membrane fusion protein
MSARRKLMTVIGTLALAAVAALAIKFVSGSRSTSQAEEAAEPPPPVSIVAGQVKSHDVPIYLRGVGTVIAYNNVVVRSQITGQLVKISFLQGQTVKTGDVLAVIDPRPYQAQLDQAIANRDRDKAHLANARIDLDRYNGLAKQKSIAQQLADSQVAIVDQLVAMVKADEAIIQSAEVNLGYTNLTSPIDGVTGIRQVDIGNIVHPTDVNGLVDVTQIEPISLIFTLPQADFVKIQERMAKGTLTVFVDGQDGKQLDQGKLNLIDNQILQATGTIRLRAEFPNKQHLLWPGELVNARLLLDTQPNALTVDASAVQQGPRGAYVYVVDPNKTARMQPVHVAQIDGGQALIDQGLTANEEVVVAGQYRLQPGSRVTELHGKAASEVQQSEVEQEVP